MERDEKAAKEGEVGHEGAGIPGVSSCGYSSTYREIPRQMLLSVVVF